MIQLAHRLAAMYERIQIIYAMLIAAIITVLVADFIIERIFLDPTLSISYNTFVTLLTLSLAVKEATHLASRHESRDIAPPTWSTWIAVYTLPLLMLRLVLTVARILR